MRKVTERVISYCLLYSLSLCNYTKVTDEIFLSRMLSTEVSTEAISSLSNCIQVANVSEVQEEIVNNRYREDNTFNTPEQIAQQYGCGGDNNITIISVLSTEVNNSKLQKRHEELLIIKYRSELFKCSQLHYYVPSKPSIYMNYKLKNKDISWENVITYVNIGLDHNFYTNIDSIKDPSGLTILVNKYNQIPDNYEPENLEYISPEYSSGSLCLRSEARVAFEDMCRAARSEGLYLKAISAYRSYSYQAKLYLKKKKANTTLEDYQKERDRVSARAGHSEHQTGLAVDINSVEQSFGNTPAGSWICENSYKFGFILRYPKGKEEITGYDYEPWHFRYLGLELAYSVYHSGLTYDEYYIRYLSVYKINLRSQHYLYLSEMWRVN